MAKKISNYQIKAPDRLYIKGIVLDLGGVVLDIDYNRTLQAFEMYGIRFTNHNAFTGANELFNQFDCGLIGPDNFRNNFNQMFGVTLNANEFDTAWNALLLDWDMERLKLVERLKQHFKVFLLSNTNAIHFEHYNSLLKSVTGKELKDYFHKVYLSFELGLRKPQVEIFRKVLDENGLLPGNALLIDDTQEHVNSAAGIGIKTIHLKGGNAQTPLAAAVAELLP